MQNLWEHAKSIHVETGCEIVGGFDAGFDSRIPEATQAELMRFAYWVEDHCALPVTLWIDFRYRHYLLSAEKKRVAYRFYWVDYESLASFDSFDDIPVIELAARCEKQTMDEILIAFAEAVTCYFAWLSGLDMHTFRPDKALAEEILAAYKNT